jgi:hypothetical protein
MAPRTVDALLGWLGLARDDFPSIKGLDYFQTAGYGST